MIADLRPALRTFLLGDPAISSAVAGARIFPIVLPQGVRDPSIVYTRVSGLGDHHMQGASGLTRPRYQIDAWAQQLDEASEIADLVKGRIDGYRGPMGAIVVQGVFVDTEREDYDGEAQLYRVSRDYLIFFGER